MSQTACEHAIAYKTIIFLFCALKSLESKWQCFREFCIYVLNNKDFDKLIEYHSSSCMTYSQNGIVTGVTIHEVEIIGVLSHNLLLSLCLLNHREVSPFLQPDSIFVILLNYISSIGVTMHSYCFIEFLHIFISTLDRRNIILKLLSNETNFNTVIKILVLFINTQLQWFDYLYQKYVSRGIFDALKTKVGMENAKFPRVNWSLAF